MQDTKYFIVYLKRCYSNVWSGTFSHLPIYVFEHTENNIETIQKLSKSEYAETYYSSSGYDTDGIVAKLKVKINPQTINEIKNQTFNFCYDRCSNYMTDIVIFKGEIKNDLIESIILDKLGYTGVVPWYINMILPEKLHYWENNDIKIYINKNICLFKKLKNQKDRIYKWYIFNFIIQI